MPIPKVAIVGRPNVGKSSIFNWLAGHRLAIVDDVPGVTRDRVSYLMGENDRYFDLVDTGGLGIQDTDNLSKQVEEQISVGIDEAAVVLFVIDAIEGLTGMDEEISKRLRRAAADIEDELVAVAELHQPTRGGLSASHRRVSRADTRDSHLVRRELFLFWYEMLGILLNGYPLLLDYDGSFGEWLAAERHGVASRRRRDIPREAVVARLLRRCRSANGERQQRQGESDLQVHATSTYVTRSTRTPYCRTAYDFQLAPPRRLDESNLLSTPERS